LGIKFYLTQQNSCILSSSCQLYVLHVEAISVFTNKQIDLLAATVQALNCFLFTWNTTFWLYFI